MSAQVPQRAARLHQLWGALPDSSLSEDALLDAILRVLDRGPGQEATASALRHSLVGCGAVIATRDGSGGITYKKAETFPSWPDAVGPGSAAYDRQLAELSEEEERERDRADAEVERRAPINQQRRELDQHLRRVVREEFRGVLRAELTTLVRRYMDEQGLRERVQALIDKNQAAQAVGND